MKDKSPIRSFVLQVTAAGLGAAAIVSTVAVLSWPDRTEAAASVTRREPAPTPVPVDPLFDPTEYAADKVPASANPELISYGKQLIEETYRYIGPAAAEPSQRYAGNELACKSCHLNSGLKKFAAPWVGVTHRYPNFRNRENRVGSIEQRVNGCMQRSMNGRPLPEDSKEMRAIVAYMDWLSHNTDDKGQVKGKGFVKVNYPDRAVDLAHGKQVYSTTCTTCHGPEGLGVKLAGGHGYQFPPLAGPDSYNTGAGMHRVLTAMAFIKGNMPLGTNADSPSLSDEDAYDVAGYINSLERPVKADTSRDFPDRKLKPMSTPYPPYADDFSQEQHKYGPFGPIQRFYAQKHGLNKTK